MALTPIGFDGPPPIKTSIAAPDALAKIDTTGLSILQQTQQSTEQMFKVHSSNLNEQAQAGAQLARSAEANAQQIAQASTYAARASADSARNTAQQFQQLSATVGQIAETQQQRKQNELRAMLAAQKEQRDRNAAALIPQLEKAKSDFLAKDGFRTEGPDAYRDLMSGLIAASDIEPDKAAEYGGRYLPEAYEQQQGIIKEQMESAAGLRKQQLRTQKDGVLIKLTGALGAMSVLDTADPEQIQQQAAVIQDQIKEVYGLPGFSELEKATIVADTIEVFRKEYGDVVFARAKLQETSDRNRTYIETSDKLRVQAQAGGLSAGQANDQLRQLASSLGIQFTPVDVNRDARVAAELLGLNNQFKKARAADIAEQREALPSSADTISAIAIAGTLSPTVRAELEAAKDLDPGAKEALRYIKEFDKFKTGTVPAYRARVETTSAAIQAKQDSFVSWLAKASSAEGTDEQHSVMEELRNRGLGMSFTPGTNRIKLTPEMRQAAEQAMNNQVQAEQNKLKVYTDAYNQQVQKYEVMGLFLDPRKSQARQKELEGVMKERAAQLKQIEATRPLTSTAYPPGNNPNFNGGASAPAKPLARRQYMGSTITMPFRAEDVGKVAYDPGHNENMHYGAVRDGGARKHQGTDFAVPQGTHAVSMVYGTVTQSKMFSGYGNGVEIKGDDGQTYFYAHGSARNVKVGERVAPGQTVMLTGDTGTPGSFHLHFEVGAKGATIDPIGHLASKDFGAPIKQPRTAGGAVTIATPQGTVQPKGIHIGGGQYLDSANGTITTYKAPSGLTGAVARAVNSIPVNYTPATPLQPSLASRSGSAYKYDESDTHGYAKLRQNPALAAELNRQAKRFGIPGQWLADLIAYESANTFSPSVDNGVGYVGLIQFGKAVAKDLNVTQEQIRNMNPVQQMKLAGDYLQLRLRQAGVKAYTGPESLVAAVNQGNVGLQQVAKYGARAVLDPQNRDGAGTTLKYYMENLGKFAGRQYDYLGRRPGPVHTATTKGCAMCAAMGANVVAHRG
jgi:murein DD-endopeptidase MepM/ murein hydrolase activator NlpD